MKKLLFASFIVFLSLNSIWAQSPKAFKYQAIIRDTIGITLSEQLISIKISILKGDINGDVAYSEIHDIRTNKFGLISLEIGNGLVITGDFSEISWGENLYFIETGIDISGGMDYRYLGSSQLLAVPYALYAETSGSSNCLWKDSDDGIYYDDGNVGIGTDTVNYRLEVYDSTTTFFVRNHYFENETMSQIGIGNTSNGRAGIYFDASDGDFNGLDYGSLEQFDDLSIALSNRAETPIRFGVGDIYGPKHFKMSIMPSGNVGIGTNTPTAMLDIQIPATDSHIIWA